MTTSQPEPVLACNREAIPQTLRAAHAEQTRHLLAALQEVQVLPTGYALRLPNETEILQGVLAFLINERLCCPFLHFTLDIQAEAGPIWLHMTGVSDVKAFIQSEFGLSESLEKPALER